jgi:hypothetical protein
MIFVVERPAVGLPHAWFAFDADDLLRKVAAASGQDPWEVHDVATARQLLDDQDSSPQAADVRQRFPGICALADAAGWDSPLYRADALLGRGCYRAQPVSLYDAVVAALGRSVPHDVADPCRIYWTEAAATAAMERADDPFWRDDGWRARLALRQQLIATEVLADDL